MLYYLVSTYNLITCAIFWPIDRQKLGIMNHYLAVEIFLFLSGPTYLNINPKGIPTINYRHKSFRTKTVAIYTQPFWFGLTFVTHITIGSTERKFSHSPIKVKMIFVLQENG